MTAIPTDVMLLRWVFTLLENSNPAEIAITGIHARRAHVTGNTVSWQSDIDALANEVRDSWVAHVDPSLFSTTLALNRAEVYHLGTDGKTLDKGTAVASGTSAFRGTVGGSLPWECALAVTTYGWDPATFNADANNQRGRMYLPGIPSTAMASGTPKVDSTYIDRYVTAMANLLDDLQGKHIGATDITGLDADSIRIGVLSRVKGTFTEIVQMSIDNKVDSQRRRQNKLGGGKTFHTITP